MNGSGDADAGAAPQDVSNSANRKMNLRLDDFIMSAGRGLRSKVFQSERL